MNKTKSFLTGDWYCVICHTHNFARRTDCFKCQAAKPDSTNGPAKSSNYHSANQAGKLAHNFQYPKGSRLKRGDWFCSEESCRSVNFAYRTSCFQCGADKPIQPNEWSCPRCTFQNKGFRVVCMRCQERNPGEIQMREGDWLCQSGDCNHLNFARRTRCQECGEAKSKSADKRTDIQAEPKKSQSLLSSTEKHKVFSSGSSNEDEDHNDAKSVSSSAESVKGR